MSSRRKLLTAIGSTGVLALAMAAGTANPAASAQDMSATPATDMGNCVAALGIGTDGDACVNVIHASPDAPAVDVYVNGEKVLAGLAFGQALVLSHRVVFEDFALEDPNLHTTGAEGGESG